VIAVLTLVAQVEGKKGGCPWGASREWQGALVAGDADRNGCLIPPLQFHKPFKPTVQ
jgi:hypothetical protein